MGANAQTSVPTFVSGEVLTAANMNISAATGIPVFATTATRDAGFGGTGEKTLAEGQLCYVEAAPKKYMVYTGTDWVPFDIEVTGYTPTLTNVTLGNGTIIGRYQRVGAYCIFGIHLVFGSTTSVSGNIGFSLPFTAASSATTRSMGVFALGDTGTNTFWGVGLIIENGTKIDIYAQNATSTYVFTAGTSSTVPHTWANTDELYGTIVYRYI